MLRLEELEPRIALSTLRAIGHVFHHQNQHFHTTSRLEVQSAAPSILQPVNLQFALEHADQFDLHFQSKFFSVDGKTETLDLAFIVDGQTFATHSVQVPPKGHLSQNPNVVIDDTISLAVGNHTIEVQASSPSSNPLFSVQALEED
jgi:hypothetical protein